MVLDRATDERSDASRVEALRADPEARVLAAGHDGVLLGGDGLLRAAAPERRPGPILLGIEDGHGVFATDLDALSAADRASLGGELVSLRDAVARLPQAEGGLASYLAALLNWHRRHGFCANCGTETVIEDAGMWRRCPSCGVHHFPRTDPVVIMTVEHDGRLLLGRRAGWPAPRMSVLAGFVGPGESAEEAVVREVAEESGILARDPVYVSSQPWPFPASLMLGFAAVSDGGDPAPSDGELEEVSWYTAAEMAAATRDENPSLVLPPAISIARYLIERWVRERGAGE
jgi:NAD+ diphosphatase